MSSEGTAPETSPADVKRKELSPAAFSVSARVAMQLGRESISSSHTAIIELVKNAYDADAENVLIRFDGLDGDGKGSRLLIEDNGSGMSESELRDYWLFIGTTNKKTAVRSKGKNRVQTGEKGLGRLGLDRLCERTILQTVRKHDGDAAPEMFPEVDRRALELTLDWSQYEGTSERLELIEHSLSALSHLNFDPITFKERSFPHGTRLLLEGLKDSWTPEEIQELRTELSLLLSPFASGKDFVIEIETGLNDPDLDGCVHPDPTLLELATWKVEASIESVDEADWDDPNEPEEQVSIRMTSPAHERAFIPDPIRWNDFAGHQTTPEVSRRLSRCGSARLEFYVFIREKEELERRGASLPALNEFMEANRGIRIYRDGFRVKPFGDPSGENDWLRLSLRRASNPAAISRPSWSLAYHQVVGAVFISRVENAALVDQTNREGIVKGKAFDDLRFFAEKTVQYFEGRAHEDYVSQNSSKEKPKKPKDEPIQQAREAIKRLKKGGGESGASAPETNESNEEVLKALEALKAAEEERRQTQEDHELELGEFKEEVRLMTSLASLGIMTASFGHERANDANEVLNHAARLRQHIRNPQLTLFSKEERLEMLDSLLAGAERVEAFASFALDHVRPWKRRPSPTNLKRVISQTLDVFHEIVVARYRIDVQKEWSEAEEYYVPGWEAGWESVLVNLISNACWALETKLAEDRRISIKLLTSAKGEVCLIFDDSGRGIEGGTIDDIFRPGFSTKRDHHENPIGTGMGLALVSNFLRSIRGSVSVTSGEGLGGARFEIKARRLKSPNERSTA